MEKRFKKDGGITLIALIITIIIMLILVAVSINILIKSNLIGAAEKTAKGYKTAYEQENEGGVVINGKKYASVEDYVKGKVKLPDIKAGERASENSQYKTAVIPKGFTVSGISTEQSVENGLVIYDIPEEDLKDSTKVDWTNPDTVKTKYNQFVWIPVEVTSEDTEESVAAFRESGWEDSEDGGQRKEGGFLETGTELTKSIYNYGGFWIGRYEAGVKPEADGTETPRTSSSSQTAEFVIQQDKYPYTYLDLFDAAGTARYLSNNLYNSSIYGAKSELCTGAAWDSILEFIKDKEHNLFNSSNWGNCEDAEPFQVFRGMYLGNIWRDSFTNVSDDGFATTKGKLVIFTTGATERNQNKNLYDISGNCSEWLANGWCMDEREGAVQGGLGLSATDLHEGPGYAAYSGDIGFFQKTSSFRPLLFVID